MCERGSDSSGARVSSVVVVGASGWALEIWLVGGSRGQCDCWRVIVWIMPWGVAIGFCLGRLEEFEG